MVIDNPKFNIGDYIYHILPEFRKGIVLDVSYSIKHNCFKYLVAWSEQDCFWQEKEELTFNKTF